MLRFSLAILLYDKAFSTFLQNYKRVY